VRSSPALEYVITTALDGTVRLSKCGSWGNIPKASMVEAEADAARDAGKLPFQIQRKRLRL